MNSLVEKLKEYEIKTKQIKLGEAPKSEDSLANTLVINEVKPPRRGLDAILGDMKEGHEMQGKLLQEFEKFLNK